MRAAFSERRVESIAIPDTTFITSTAGWSTSGNRTELGAPGLASETWASKLWGPYPRSARTRSTLTHLDKREARYQQHRPTTANTPYPPSMPQGLVRHLRNQHLHFVTFSCYHRRPHLNTPHARTRFEHSLKAMRRRHSFHVISYVVMPERPTCCSPNPTEPRSQSPSGPQAFPLHPERTMHFYGRPVTTSMAKAASASMTMGT